MTHEKKNIVVVLDHDMFFRHFVDSGALKLLAEQNECVFIVPPGDYKGGRRVQVDLDAFPLPGRVIHLDMVTERRAVWAKLAHISKLRWRPGTHYAAGRQTVRWAIGPGHVREYTFLALPLVWEWYRWRCFRWLAENPNPFIETLLDDFQPDIVIHPSALEGPYVFEFISICRARGIPYLTLMNSWDNISGKAMNMVVKPEWLAVWGPQAEGHARNLLRMPMSRVLTLGSAQFQVYDEPPINDRRALRRLNGLSEDGTVVLYAGTSKDTDEFEHLKLLDQAIEDGRLPRFEILYRPHPWGSGGVEGGRILDHPWRHVRIESSMREYLERVKSDGPQAIYPDYNVARDVMMAVDAVITPLSTMMVEALMLGKPALCYLPMDEKDAKHFQLAYKRIHFRDALEMPEILVAHGLDELVGQAGILLERLDEPGFPEQARKAASFFVAGFDRPYAERLCEAVDHIVGSKAA